jgi:hypothetical protein
LAKRGFIEEVSGYLGDDWLADGERVHQSCFPKPEGGLLELLGAWDDDV